MAMSYGYVYVASVAMGANKNQLMKALWEAETYDGPSLVIAYSPCINHGINMGLSQLEEKKAVDAGYWLLYRYDPRRRKRGKTHWCSIPRNPRGISGSFSWERCATRVSPGLSRKTPKPFSQRRRKM
jgi:pyruvate-ferredoxin/flavodoxin oxidoreductase